MCNKGCCRKNRGFSMVEILIALLIVLTSIMGVASLLARTTQQEVESAQRVEALVLLQDMIDKINANRQVAACYSNGAAGRAVGSGENAPAACGLGVGTAGQRSMADLDIVDWHRTLRGASAQASGDAEDVGRGAMIGARGCVQQVSAVDQTYRVTVVWQGLGNATPPPQAVNCGQNAFGDEALRRVVTALIRIGDLS